MQSLITLTRTVFLLLLLLIHIGQVYGLPVHSAVGHNSTAAVAAHHRPSAASYHKNHHHHHHNDKILGAALFACTSMLLVSVGLLCFASERIVVGMERCIRAWRGREESGDEEVWAAVEDSAPQTQGASDLGAREDEEPGSSCPPSTTTATTATTSMDGSDTLHEPAPCSKLPYVEPLRIRKPEQPRVNPAQGRRDHGKGPAIPPRGHSLQGGEVEALLADLSSSGSPSPDTIEEDAPSVYSNSFEETTNPTSPSSSGDLPSAGLPEVPTVGFDEQEMMRLLTSEPEVDMVRLGEVGTLRSRARRCVSGRFSEQDLEPLFADVGEDPVESSPAHQDGAVAAAEAEAQPQPQGAVGDTSTGMEGDAQSMRAPSICTVSTLSSLGEIGQSRSLYVSPDWNAADEALARQDDPSPSSSSSLPASSPPGGILARFMARSRGREDEEQGSSRDGFTRYERPSKRPRGVRPPPLPAKDSPPAVPEKSAGWNGMVFGVQGYARLSRSEPDETYRAAERLHVVAGHMSSFDERQRALSK